MEGYDVTPEDVQQAATDCWTTAEDIKQELAAIKGYVAGLRDQWQGVAAQNFDQLMIDFDAFALMLNNALVNISYGLRGNFNNYVSVEEFASNNLVAVNNEIPGVYL
ncbi:WXG100 family type VII secretion target [Catenuloplanes atrovinosus]|uniref:ESAT-6-like protein n=1 Tax=Catenuloplanes atrovinosus TaxID=137266 RepID=A0AAE3YKS2_9ACTN|nr:WXG100 family type VII secretion target [Catenuloplanes atrovinosus]MDR7274224.1 WXG100 family type VII secretion target [Catenuloplanes atrovinosus]